MDTENDASAQSAASRLVLGGHTFIHQLGSDPPADERAQCDIVEACLNAGIACFDTTYRPERVALGRALEALGRRDEATIIAWNFFRDFGPNDDVGGPSAYTEDCWQRISEDLRTDHVDLLVVHPLGDPAADRAQLDVVEEWQSLGRIGELGTWMPGVAAAAAPYTFMVAPFNVGTPRAEARAFERAKALGWRTFATSPFVRGWDLDARVARARARSGEPESELRARIADAMLRYTAFGSGVDRVIVQMRRPEWIAANVQSIAKGPLSDEQRGWLFALGEDGTKPG